MFSQTKILIIDDEPDHCNFVKKNLEFRGSFTVFIAYSGEEGIALAKTDKPDLILLDLMMPAMCGTDVAILLQEDCLTKNIPIIFLTAIVTPEDVELKDIKNIGGYNYMAKPADTKKLISGIVTVLKGKVDIF
ncbi:MAG: response regulator [Candidatus Omnitrophota bacterium]